MKALLFKLLKKSLDFLAFFGFCFFVVILFKTVIDFLWWFCFDADAIVRAFGVPVMFSLIGLFIFLVYKDTN